MYYRHEPHCMPTDTNMADAEVDEMKRNDPRLCNGGQSLSGHAKSIDYFQYLCKSGNLAGLKLLHQLTAL